MKPIVNLAAIVALALPFAGQAAEVNYSFVELDYIEMEIDDADADGFQLRGSLEVHPSAFVFAEFADVEFDGGVDGETWALGVGGHMPLNTTWDLVGKLGIVNQEAGAYDDDAIMLGAGIRGMVAPKLEVDLGLEYADLDEPLDGLNLVGEARYNFNPQVSAGVLARIGDDLTTIGIGGRYSF